MRHVDSETSPATARLDDALARLQPHLAADVVHFRYLRFIERSSGCRVVGARVRHGPAQPQRIKLVAYVVVMMNVVARAVQGVDAPTTHHFDTPAQNGEAAPGSRAGTVNGFEYAYQITVDADATLAVGLAKADLRIGQ